MSKIGDLEKRVAQLEADVAMLREHRCEECRRNEEWHLQKIQYAQNARNIYGYELGDLFVDDKGKQAQLDYVGDDGWIGWHDHPRPQGQIGNSSQGAYFHKRWRRHVTEAADGP